jgi:hypothetical protein
MQFEENYDLQAAHEREFRDEAHEKFVRTYPYKVVESLDAIQTELRSIRGASDFAEDIYERIDRFVCGGLVDENLKSTRQIENTLHKIKLALYLIAFLLLCVVVK